MVRACRLLARAVGGDSRRHEGRDGRLAGRAGSDCEDPLLRSLVLSLVLRDLTTTSCDSSRPSPSTWNSRPNSRSACSTRRSSSVRPARVLDAASMSASRTANRLVPPSSDIAQRHMRELLERDFNNLKQDIRMLEKIDFDKIRVEIAEIEKKVRLGCHARRKNVQNARGLTVILCMHGRRGWLATTVPTTKAGGGRDAERAAAVDGEGGEAHAPVRGRFRRHDHGRRRRTHPPGAVEQPSRQQTAQHQDQQNQYRQAYCRSPRRTTG